MPCGCPLEESRINNPDTSTARGGISIRQTESLDVQPLLVLQLWCAFHFTQTIYHVDQAELNMYTYKGVDINHTSFGLICD